METMGMDDYFKKPGAVPFKWEIKPGVPKSQQQQQPQPQPQHNASTLSSEFSSPKLRLPPSRSYVFSSGRQHWTRSFHSIPPVQSDRWRFDRPFLARSNSLPSSGGCFLSPFLKRLSRWKMNRKPMVEPDSGSDLETLSVWSMSSRKFPSPLRDSSPSSNQSSIQTTLLSFDQEFENRRGEMSNSRIHGYT